MKKSIIIFALISILVSACSSPTPTPEPTAPQASPVVEATATEIPPTATASPVPPIPTIAPTATATQTTTLFPTVTTSENVTCRQGPDINYYKVVSFSAGQSSQVQGRNEDGKWLNVLTQAPNKSYTCWVPTASVKSFDGAADLQVVVGAPLPTGSTYATAYADHNACGVNRRNGSVVVDWSPVAEGTGFFVIRNGTNIATVYGGEYIDHDTPGSKTPYVFTYVIQAFNSVGLAKVTAIASVTLCD